MVIFCQKRGVLSVFVFDIRHFSAVGGQPGRLFTEHPVVKPLTQQALTV
jgi:hypothetical protein